MDPEIVYRSTNGDDWLLERPENGEAVVLHRANPASGGSQTRMTASEFLERSGASPEGQAVRAALSAKDGA